MTKASGEILVRNGLERGLQPFYQDGVDCSVDPYTGEVGLVSATKQAFADECDINTIMKRYQTTGDLSPFLARVPPQYGDFATSTDFQSSMNIVIAAEQQFAELPATLRERFGNDPSELLKFLDDPKNKDEAIKLGIVNAPPVPEAPVKVEVINPTPQPSPSPAEKPAQPAS